MGLENKIRIRNATDKDLEDVFPMIDRENWYWTKLEVAQILNFGKDHSLVAVLQDKIVGILFVLRNEDRRIHGLQLSACFKSLPSGKHPKA